MSTRRKTTRKTAAPVFDPKADLNDQMLSAMMDTGSASAEEDPLPPLDEQKRYLKRYVDVLTIADRKDVGGILVLNGRLDAIQACPEGVVINLDALAPEIINQMYNLTNYKIKKYSGQ